MDVLLSQDDYIDLVIPRGGEGLIRAVTEKSRIPVLQHYKGVCHVYVDESANAEMAKGDRRERQGLSGPASVTRWRRCSFIAL